MPPPLVRAVQYLRRMARQPGDPAADRQLLAAFAARHDDDAFAELVRRHGPLVMGVCRRVLGDAHAAEDAFQATFLTLARHAGSRRWRLAIGPWLYGVAYRLAHKARRTETRRRRHERQVPPPTPADPLADVAWRDLRRRLDDELARLPERVRAPLVLCYLDGLTRDEAARRLGWSLATLKRRLERGRAILRARLGPCDLSPLLLPAALERPAVSWARALTMAETARTYLTGGAVATTVGALIEGTGSKLAAKSALAFGLLVTAGALAVGTTRLAAPAVPQMPPIPAKPAAPPAVQRDRVNDPLPAGAISRFGTTALRHGSDIRGMQFTPDGRHLVSWAWDGVRVWDASSGVQVRCFAEWPKGPPWQMNCAALSPDSATMAIVFGNPREEQGGDFLNQGGQLGNIEIWDVTTGQMRLWFPTRRFAAPVFTPDGRTLAVLGSDERDGNDSYAIPLVDVATGRELRRLHGHQGDTRGLVFRPDGREAITTSEDGTIRVWDVAGGREVRQFAKPPVPVGELVLSSDGRWLATVDRPRKLAEGFTIGNSSEPNALSPIRLWDVATGREAHVFPGHKGGTSYLAFTPDGRQLLSASLDRLVRVWDIATGRELRTLPEGFCRGLAVSPDGRTLATAGLRAIQLRNLATGERYLPPPAPQNAGNLIAITPDGRSVATTGVEESAIFVWELATGKLLRKVQDQAGNVSSLSWSLDGKTLLFAEDAEQSATLRRWDIASGRTSPPLTGFDKPFSFFLPLPDGRRIVTGASAAVWDLTTGRSLREFPSIGVPQGITADGRALLSIDDNKNVYLSDLTTGAQLSHFTIENTVVPGGPLSPDGRWLAAGGPEKSLAIYDTATGREVRLMEGLGDRISSLTFSTDSRQLAGGDHTQGVVHIWDVATGRKLRDFAGHRGTVNMVCFTPDGRRLVSCGSDTTALIWDVSAAGAPSR